MSAVDATRRDTSALGSRGPYWVQSIYVGFEEFALGLRCPGWVRGGHIGFEGSMLGLRRPRWV